MRLRRVRLTDGSGPSVAVLDGERWIPLVPALALTGDDAVGAGARDVLALLAGGEAARDAVHTLIVEVAGADLSASFDAAPMLPLQPAALRSFASWKQHWVQGARGLQRRYVPAARPVVDLFERVTRQTFPPFRPGRRFYSEPSFYMGNHLNYLTEGDTLPWPRFCRDLDYELELGAVLAAPLADATPAQAESAIGGFVVLNDLSMRDVQWREYRGGLFGPCGKTKTFANAMSCELASADEVLPRIASLRGEVRVNGELWTDTSTAGMQHSFGELLAEASRGEPLHPGEVISSGTMPNGCGLELDRWLQPGDEIDMRIEAVGRLRNRIGPPGAVARPAAMAEPATA
jgi:2-keto-4-pentenoate hydratase/2-oxohepta-3-ene-1,7-dioic acid hydratase in catechol pathway